MRKLFCWSPPSGELKFNVDVLLGVSHGWLGLKGSCTIVELFFRNVLKHVSILDSDEADLLAILEALSIFTIQFHDRFVVESKFKNVVHWITFPVGCSRSLPLPLLIQS